MKRFNIDEVIKNGGATLKSTLENADLTSGFMVSLQNYETVVELNSLENMQEIEKVLAEYQGLSKKLGAYIGLWINENKLYIDLSKNYKRLGNAKKVGLKNKQLGIFNLNNFETIML